MNLKKFNNYMNVIENARDAENNNHDVETHNRFVRMGKWALNKLELIFNDKEKNIQRWLTGKECIFRSDKTGEVTAVKIGNDIEALYYFLIFNSQVQDKNEIEEYFLDDLERLIRKSNSKNWEEC